MIFYKFGIFCHNFFEILQKKAIVEIGVNNPTPNDINLEVEIHGMGLSGAKDILVPAKGRFHQLLYIHPLL